MATARLQPENFVITSREALYVFIAKLNREIPLETIKKVCAGLVSKKQYRNSSVRTRTREMLEVAILSGHVTLTTWGNQLPFSTYPLGEDEKCNALPIDYVSHVSASLINFDSDSHWLEFDTIIGKTAYNCDSLGKGTLVHKRHDDDLTIVLSVANPSLAYVSYFREEAT
jgi:hypothetical protein